MTHLIASIFVDRIEDLDPLTEKAWAEGADAVELRIDTFDGPPERIAEYIQIRSDRLWIVTCRSEAEGGHFHGDTSERVSRLIAATRGTDAFVDFELADWMRSSNIRQKVLLASARAGGQGHRLILSAHRFDGTQPKPKDLEGLSLFPLSLSKREVRVRVATDDSHSHCIHAPTGTVLKSAYSAARITDSFAALDMMKTAGEGAVGIAMGEAGLWTRVLAKKLGAFGTYASISPDAATASGQLTVEEMIDLYRWRSIDAATRVFGVIGTPVGHSMSPALFNRWFEQAGINGVYLPLLVSPEEDCLAEFLTECQRRPWLAIGGFSVTIPHKQAALHWLGPRADRSSHFIGTVNTIVDRGQEYFGYNTDCYAAIDSLTQALGCAKSNLAGVSIDVLGSGGSARAVVSGLTEVGAAITVYGRNRSATDSLAQSFGCKVADWKDRIQRSGEIIINCTPLGMSPNTEDSPLSTSPRPLWERGQGEGVFSRTLGGCRLVFDLIYNPLRTRLLHDAELRGIPILNGLDMFIRQAAMQFELWTGRTPNPSTAHDFLTQSLGKYAK